MRAHRHDRRRRAPGRACGVDVHSVGRRSDHHRGRTQPGLAAAGLDPARGGFGQELRQVKHGKQEIGSAARAGNQVEQVGEHRRRASVRRRVERRKRERSEHPARDARGHRRQHRVDRFVGRAAEACVAQGLEPAQRVHAIAHARPLGQRDGGREIPGGREAWDPQRHRARVRRERHEGHRLAPQSRVDAPSVHRAQERARRVVGADEQVLAVVDRKPCALDPSRAPAEHRSRFVDDDRDAAARERPRGGAAGPAAADDGRGRGEAAALRLAGRVHLRRSSPRATRSRACAAA